MTGAAGGSFLTTFPRECVFSTTRDAANQQPWLLTAAEEGEWLCIHRSSHPSRLTSAWF